MTDSWVGTEDAATAARMVSGSCESFARTHKRDPSDVPDDVWKKLIKPTYDGIDVKPLYMRTDQDQNHLLPVNSHHTWSQAP